MALIKEKILASGESGDYWRVSNLVFHREGMRLELELSLYKSAALAASMAPALPYSYRFHFVIQNSDLVGNLISMAYGKIKGAIDAVHPSLSGSGPDASYYPDLIGYVDG